MIVSSVVAVVDDDDDDELLFGEQVVFANVAMLKIETNAANKQNENISSTQLFSTRFVCNGGICSVRMLKRIL